MFSLTVGTQGETRKWTKTPATLTHPTSSKLISRILSQQLKADRHSQALRVRSWLPADSESSSCCKVIPTPLHLSKHSPDTLTTGPGLLLVWKPMELTEQHVHSPQELWREATVSHLQWTEPQQLASFLLLWPILCGPEVSRG